MTRRLIFVHGINNEHRTRQQVETLWANALRAALGTRADDWWDTVEIKTAYYADVLDAEEKSWGLYKTDGMRMSASSPDADYVDGDLAALYLAFQDKYDITDRQIAENLEDGDEIAGMRQAAGVHKNWIKALTRTLEIVIPGAGNALARVALAQAATYLNKDGVFEKINDLVQEQVLAHHAPGTRTVVVSHSLGTIVTYVLLRRMKSQPDFPLFITLGSPLGIEIVRRRIGPPYLNPPPVPKWINGADPEDFVALHPSLNADTFGNAKITNYSDIENGHEDAHDITGYLRDPRIAQAVLEAFTK